MSRRKNVVRELMREYRKLDSSHPNKKEVKRFLLDEMDDLFPSMLDINEAHLEGWIDNEFKNEIMEKMEAFVSASYPNEVINLEEVLAKDTVDGYEFKIPNLK